VKTPVKLPRSDYFLDGLVLLAFNTVFALHFYHERFIVMGDVFMNLYLHGNPGLVITGWDPYAWGYLGWYPISGVIFPINVVMHALVRLFDGSPVATLHLLQINAVLSLFLIAYFFYVFFRHMGIGRGGGLLGAIILTSTGFHVHTGIREFDLFYLHSFMFVPLVLLALARANREKSIKWAVAGGAFIGLSLLGGGNVPMFMYAPCFVFVYLIDRPLREMFSPRRFLRSSIYTGVAGAVGMAVGAAMILPSLKYMDYSLREFAMGDYLTSKEFSMAPSYTLLTMLYKDWWPRGDEFAVAIHELDSFIGVPAILLVCVGVFLTGRTAIRGKWFMAVLAAFALLAMHIAYMPTFLSEAYQFVMTKMSIRHPYRFAMVLLLPVSFFAACGFDFITRSYREAERKASPIVLRAFLALGAMAVVAYVAAGVLWMEKVPPELKFPHGIAMSISVASYLAVAYLLLSARPGSAANRFLGGSLILLLFFFYFFSMGDYPLRENYSARDMKRAAPLAIYYGYRYKDALHDLFEKPRKKWLMLTSKEKTPFRIYNPGDVLRQNLWAPRDKVDIAFEPYMDPATSKLICLYQLQAESVESPLFDLYNVKFLKMPIYAGSKYTATYIKDIYRNPYAFERFFTVHGVRFFDTEERLRASLSLSKWKDLREYVYLTYEAEARREYRFPRGEGEDEIRILERKPDRIVLQADMTSEGYLVASEPWFPAWRAEVDGEEAELYRAYGTFWTVHLKEGSHRVVFSFFDWYAFWGRIISVLSLLSAAGLFAYLHLKYPPPGPHG
jgi:hypothetical protein